MTISLSTLLASLFRVDALSRIVRRPPAPAETVETPPAAPRRWMNG